MRYLLILFVILLITLKLITLLLLLIWAKKVYTKGEHEDEELLQHVTELLQELGPGESCFELYSEQGMFSKALYNFSITLWIL